MSALRDLTDPTYTGPGNWYTIHKMAYEAQNEIKKRRFWDYIEFLRNNFSCKQCRQHMQNYINDNPIASYWDRKDKNGREYGMFEWSWRFHNAVNKRLGKTTIDNMNDAMKMYMEETLDKCTAACAGEQSKSLSSKTKTLPTPSPLKKINVRTLLGQQK